MNNFEDIIYERLIKKEHLSEHEIRTLLNDFEQDNLRIEGDSFRWTQSISSIVKIKDKYFEIDWDAALTEYQENFYPYQPFEVEPKVETKVIQELVWKPVKEEK